MSLVEIQEAETRPLPAMELDPPCPIRVQGKFFFVGERKHFIKGVTYGPFAQGSHGAQFPDYATVDTDFALMAEAGINTVRVFTVPPIWLKASRRPSLVTAYCVSRQRLDATPDPGGGDCGSSPMPASSSHFRLSGR